jgi:hypothetical protein
MTKLEVTKIEDQLNGRSLFNVRAYMVAGQFDLPIGIQTLGSPALDEAAVLRSALGIAEEVTAAAKVRLEQ